MVVPRAPEAVRAFADGHPAFRVGTRLYIELRRGHYWFEQYTVAGDNADGSEWLWPCAGYANVQDGLLVHMAKQTSADFVFGSEEDLEEALSRFKTVSRLELCRGRAEAGSIRILPVP